MLHTFLGHDMEAVRAQVNEPLTRYLRSSFDLRMRTPSKRGRVQDTDALGEREIGLVLRRAADRYFRSAGLFGPPERCVEIVEQYADIGIDEIACLIDYGPDVDATMGSLELLAQLCER
jgi:alkanesulfonate monooxygenase SsuD/methylene tetrahydromethanopterin reductase-like flavin-dependent oxidoreductase (luciferase family)